MGNKGRVKYMPTKDFLHIKDFKIKKDIYLNKSDYNGIIEFEDLNEHCILEYEFSSGKAKYAKLDMSSVDGMGYIIENVLTIQNNEKQYDNYCSAVLEYAKFLEKNGVTATTLRNIYRKVQLAGSSSNKLLEIKKLRIDYAYLAGKNPKTKPLTTVLDILTKKIEKEKDIEEFQNFLEALVAYHKYVTKSL